MTHHEWKNGGQFFSWQGQSIFYRDTGTQADANLAKPALLLIHGFPTSSYDFHGMWAALGEKYRLLAFDMLGYGFSDKPAKWNYTIHGQADIAEALMKKLCIKQSAMLCHDVGDTVGQEIMARFNEGALCFQLSKVVMLNGGLFPETHRAILMQKLMFSPLGPLLSYLGSKTQFSKSLRRVCSDKLPQADVDAAWELMRLKNGNHRLYQLIRYIQQRRDNRDRWVSALQNFKPPLAVVDGVDDPVSGAHMVERFEQLVPGRPTVRLPGLGHYPHLEDAQATLAGVLQHL